MNLVYKTSKNCQSQLAETEAIDYFFAKEMCEEFNQTNDQVFHLFIALSYFMRQGHSCLPVSVIAEQLLWQNNNEESLDKSEIIATDTLLAKGFSLANGFSFASKVQLINLLEKIQLAPENNQALVFDGELLFIRRYWQYEQEIARKLCILNQFEKLLPEQLEIGKEIISKLFLNLSNGKNSQQKIAVANALGSRFCIISGGPGTGKTYTVTRVLICLQAIYQAMPTKGQLKIAMAAPTGKAAQRLKESISHAKHELTDSIDEQILNSLPENAMTLHRLLGLKPLSLHLKYHEKYQLDCDVLLIDEASMIDMVMMVKILRALRNNCRLILLGDVNQLPSVDTGNILADITGGEHSGYLSEYAHQIKQLCSTGVDEGNAEVDENNQSQLSYLSYLEQSHRSSGDILKLAKMVINKEIQESLDILQNNSVSGLEIKPLTKGQIQFIDEATHDFEYWLKAISEFYYRPIEKAESKETAYAFLTKFRILVSTRVGTRGVIDLNNKIRQFLNHGQNDCYRGCPIMITQNSYQAGLFNGDIGLIWPDDSCGKNKGHHYAWFEDTEKKELYPIHLSRLPEYETVYAMTIHKTQGSEFDQVAVVLPQIESRLLDAKLLYTGMTRAKHGLMIYGNQAIWKKALSQDNPRYSGLKKHSLNNPECADKRDN
ncbi:MAG: exodeoxyribonuclease V subunit alpha [Gammaproteobacteria bacterium]|nr:exodeoxyribonuclease V subunit alpha [Gammaproteobacteria bacterium]